MIPIDRDSFCAGQRHATHRIAKLAIKLTTFFVLALALGMFGLAVLA